MTPLPADEREGFASVQQMNQFKSEILPIQGPLEKEDVRGVVFNNQNPGYGNNCSVFQAHPPRPPSPAAFYHSTVDGGAACGGASLYLTVGVLPRFFRSGRQSVHPCLVFRAVFSYRRRALPPWPGSAPSRCGWWDRHCQDSG